MHADKTPIHIKTIFVHSFIHLFISWNFTLNPAYTLNGGARISEILALTRLTQEVTVISRTV